MLIYKRIYDFKCKQKKYAYFKASKPKSNILIFKYLSEKFFHKNIVRLCDFLQLKYKEKTAALIEILKNENTTWFY